MQPQEGTARRAVRTRAGGGLQARAGGMCASAISPPAAFPPIPSAAGRPRRALKPRVSSQPGGWPVTAGRSRVLSRPPRPRGVFQCRKEARAGTHPRCSPGTPSMAHIPGAPGDTQPLACCLDPSLNHNEGCFSQVTTPRSPRASTAADGQSAVGDGGVHAQPHHPGTPAARGWLSPTADPTKGGCPGAGRSGGPARPPRGRPPGRGWRTPPAGGGGRSSQPGRDSAAAHRCGNGGYLRPPRDARRRPFLRDSARMGAPSPLWGEPAPRRLLSDARAERGATLLTRSRVAMA